MRKQVDLLDKIVKNAKYIEKIETGLSNDNYLITLSKNERFVVRIARENPLLDRKCEDKIVKILKPYDINVPCIYFNNENGNKITVYQKGHHIDTYELDDLKKVALLLKRLHSLELKCNRDFDSLTKLKTYYYNLIDKPFPLSKYEKLINEYQHYINKDKKILCHNDIVRGNLLFSNDKVYLIDYEYAAMNSPMFDLASFISENNIDDEASINYFLITYFGEEVNKEMMEKFYIFHCFQDLLWSLWALDNFQERNDIIYQNIYLTKINRLNRLIKVHIPHLD